MLYQYCRRLRIALLGLICCSFSIKAMADENHNMLSAKIDAAHYHGTEFKEVSLFAPFLRGEAYCHPAERNLAATTDDADKYVVLSKPQAVSLMLRNEEGKIYTLEMLQSQPVSAALTTGTINGNGRNENGGYTAGLHYQGHLAGRVNSMATMSVFANGDVMILFSNEEGNFVVGKLEDGSNNYIFYNDDAMIHRPALSCGVTEKADIKQPGTAAKGTRVLMCNKVQIYWEVAYNFYTSKGSNLTTTQNYITGLFNQVQAMYANDNIAIELKSLYVWTSQDDYPTSGSSAALDKFRGYWNTMGNTFDGNLAHLITRDNGGSGGGNGGLAYVDVLCSRNYGYGYSDIYGTLQTVPTYSWDVEVITHETGHNMGSNHTHWCGWNTGANGTCGSIDNCTTQEAGSSCTTCGATYLNSQPTTAWKGTVMSYCHLVSRGINLANGFGPLPGALIRTNVSTETCLKSAINATLTPSPICNNAGAITLTYPANNFGTAPYVYSWTSSGATTQNVTGLSTEGNYTVEITDSNNCQASFTATLYKAVNAGNGIALTETMPICCQNTTHTITLKAIPPDGLKTTCETVYWLRSEAPLSTMADVQAKFDTAQATNIIASSNAGSISNVVGARLTVTPPATCVGPVTYYYTPVAVRYVRTADSVVSNIPATNGVAYMNGSVQIGAYTTVPDQRTAVGACVLTDTPASRSLVVTVTGYTGRANNMRLIVQDGSNNILYQKFALAGNGIYTVDPAVLKDNFLGALKIIVVDFNCTTGSASTCGASAAAIAVARKAVYAAAPMRLSPACAVSTPVPVTFAPSGCTNLAVVNTAENSQPSLYPNPATHSATLKYNTNTSGNVAIRVTDLAGRIVWTASNNLTAGDHEQLLDIHAWAKGMYFVNISNGTDKTISLKLTVE